MQPIPEAVAWAERADAWAQRSDAEQAGQIVQSRWSELAAPGRTAFPEDGVGWRTETAEWRATEQTARWRQTTEWRSASGTHGWRSTTEAWQTGAGAEQFQPPADPQTRQQLAISGTAWPTPQDGDDGTTHDAMATWTSPADDNGQAGTGSWQRFAEGEWSPTDDSRPAWQQFAAPPAPWEQASPSWRQGQAWQQGAPAEPAAQPWQQDSSPAGQQPSPSRQPGSAAAWQQAQPAEPSSWGQSAPPPASASAAPWQPPAPRPGERSDGPPTWQHLVEPLPDQTGRPAWQSGVGESTRFVPSDGQHLVREDDRAAWRRDAADQENGARSVGRRRADDPRSRATGGTGWSTRPDPDNGAGHTDTGGMQRFGEPAAAEWGSRSGAPSWSAESAPETPGWRAEPAPGDRRVEPAPGDRRVEPASGDRGGGRRRWTEGDPADDPMAGGRWPGGPAASRPTSGSQVYGSPATDRPVYDGPATDRSVYGSQATSRSDYGNAAATDRSVYGSPATGRSDYGSSAAGGPLPGSPGDNGRRERPSWAQSSGPAVNGWNPVVPAGGTGGSSDPAGGPASDRWADDDGPNGTTTSWRPGGSAAANGFVPSWRQDDAGRRNGSTPAWRQGDPDGPNGTMPQDGPAPSRRSSSGPAAIGWRQSAGPAAIGWRNPDADPDDGGAPSRGQDPEPPRRRRAGPDRPSWAQSSAPVINGWAEDAGPATYGQASAGTANGRTGPATNGWTPDGAPATGWAPRSGPAAIGWRRDDDPDDRDGPRRRRAADWRDHSGETSDWREDSRESPDWRQDSMDEPGWARDGRSPPRRRRDARTRPGWQAEDDGWREPGSETTRRRREAEPADPWAQNSADTGIIPMTWQPPEADTGSWRSSTGAIGRARPTNPNRRRDDDIGPSDTSSRLGGRRRLAPDERDDAPLDPEVWRREPGSRTDGANWPPDEPRDPDWRRELQGDRAVGEALTEIRHIEPAWQREERERAARGSASYRVSNTGDWRRELAADGGGLAEGEARRPGAEGFVPFKPVGSASVAAAPVSAPNGAAPMPASDAREPWEDAADNVWPPRQPSGYRSAGGSYERRPVGGGLDTAGGRSNLLEPDEDDLEEDNGGPLAAVGYTVIWYGVPVVLFVLYMLVLNGSQQAHALSTLAGAAPQFGLSLLLSMAVAVGLRRASGSWKAASVGLAAAVMGGGLATVLTSAITGNSLS